MEAAIDLTADSDATDVDEDDASLQLALRLQREEDNARKRARDEDASLALELQRQEEAAAASSSAAGSAAAELMLPRTVAPRLDEMRVALSAAGRVALCSPPFPLELPTQREWWSCGYANLRTLLRSALGAAAGDVSPAALQRTIEAAWNAGFDPRSARQFGGRLVGKTGRAAYIGAAETQAALTHLRLDAAIVEIVRRTGSGAAVHSVAFTAFAAECFDCGGTRCPIILQHDGHSRTIVGVTSAPDALLIADPRNDQAVSVVRARDLDGRQYQMTFLVGEPGLVRQPVRRLGDAEVQSRRGESEAIAVYDDSGWRYGSTELRFG